MNRINQKLKEDHHSSGVAGKLLSIYFTAGYPQLDDTVNIIQKLEASSTQALNNVMLNLFQHLIKK